MTKTFLSVVVAVACVVNQGYCLTTRAKSCWEVASWHPELACKKTTEDCGRVWGAWKTEKKCCKEAFGDDDCTLLSDDKGYKKYIEDTKDGDAKKVDKEARCWLTGTWHPELTCEGSRDRELCKRDWGVWETEEECCEESFEDGGCTLMSTDDDYGDLYEDEEEEETEE
eukprot:Awhi_evm1s4699